MNIALALLVFPGLLLTVVLALLLRILVENDIRFGPLRLPAPGLESASAVISIALAVIGVALLPWPLHPVADAGLFGLPFAGWLAIEGAFLVPLLPGLLSLDSMVSRATSREAQLSMAGRVIVWIVAGTLLWQAEAWSLGSLPGRLLLILGGLLALPAALGVGSFAPDRNLTVAAAEHGLDAATAGLVAFARQIRGAALLATLALAAIPRAQVRPQFALLLWVALVVVIAVVLRRLNGRLPRLALPNALRWCWLRALPVALVGLVYLTLVP